MALKVLEISSQPAFLAHVAGFGGLFAGGFAALKAKHPQLLVGLRQLGLMMGIELANESLGPLFTKAAYDAGLLAIYANNDPRVVQLLPPLTIDLALAGEILERVDLALTGLAGMLAQMGRQHG